MKLELMERVVYYSIKKMGISNYLRQLTEIGYPVI